ncbi:NAD(P)/FAD-dependent oxidoreductase [Pseudomonas fulva]|nr:FAD-binding oxidoreductase [Pseudomonas fulva]MBF8780335.1 FAD-binding oxidoreductase [Pseudomonas fulva]
MLKQSPASEVIVIGAGIVGLCTAYHLLDAGQQVRIIEPSAPGAGCSSGNAGSLSSGAVAPLAMPGVLKQATNMLFDPTGPLHVPASYILHVAPWMARFIASARPARVAQIAHALHGLIGDAVQQHKRLAAAAGCADLIVETGQLHLYPNQQALAKDTAGWALKSRHGLQMVKVGPSDIRSLEPALGNGYPTGYYLPDQPWIKDPQAYSRQIAEYLRSKGVSFIEDQVTGLLRSPAGWLVKGQRRDHESQRVVLAAGAWSARLLGPLGVKVPLETQRGYHLRFPQAQDMIQRIVVLADRKVFVTPTAGGLRAAGTVEFGGLERLPSSLRARLLGEHAKAALPGLDIAQPIEWMGHRPCLPDSLPVLGELPGHSGLWCAFGHGHLGMTGAAGTGRLLAQAMSGSRQAEAALAPFSAARFR